MNKRYPKTTIRLFLTLLCILSLSMTVRAEETGGPGTDMPDMGKAPGTITDNAHVLTTGSSAGTGSKAVAEKPGGIAVNTGTKGHSLGEFITTGYCNCEECSGGYNLTYSGTVPTAKHTISADLSVLPVGTRVMIDDVIYTVEDIGSAVSGNRIDIYYDSHEAALAHGVKTQEVFAVR